MNAVRNIPVMIQRLILTWLLFVSSLCLAQPDIQLFPQVLATHERGGDYSSEYLFPAMDLYVDGSWHDSRYVLEYFWSEDENRFDRLQLGYDLAENAVIWFGRFHTPYGYWNTEFHHGNYLQTSITRPEIEAYSADGGIISSHLVGVLFEQLFNNVDGSRVKLSLAYGLASRIEDSTTVEEVTLQDVDIFSFRRSEHETGISIRGSYEPKANGGDVFGFFLMNADLVLENGQYDTIDLESMGLFTRLQWQAHRLIASLFTITTQFTGPVAIVDISESFEGAYVQYEYTASNSTRLYARSEDTRDEKNNTYLETLWDYVPQREVLGMRLDFLENHAVKVEWLNNHVESRVDQYFYIEWSTVIQ